MIQVMFQNKYELLDVQELRNLMEVSYNKPTRLDINEFSKNIED